MAGGYLAARVLGGVQLQSDFTALLPQEDRDPVILQAKDKVLRMLNARIVVLVGDADRARARAAGSDLAAALRRSGLVASVTYEIPSDGVRRLGTALFPYRFGLLAPRDRERLMQGRAQELVGRALASVYGPLGIADASLLRRDPFLLLPAYLAQLPRPLPRLGLDDGILSVQDGAEHYVLVTAQLDGEPFALTFQNCFVAAFDQAVRHIESATPDVRVLRLGAVFYGQAGAAAATQETLEISIVSLVGTVILVLAVFRALRPLWLTILSIGSGVVCAFAVSLWVFGTLHVAALLFGVSLVGIALDYCLQYLSARFDADNETPARRLRRVLPGIVLGITTTLIGYLALLLAPFPGLRQVAVFSAVGLVASFITVLLWLPALDRVEPLAHGRRLLAAADALWSFWEMPRHRPTRWVLVGIVLAAALLGASRLTVTDDIRRFQALPEALKSQEAELRRLAGVAAGSEFLLVRAADEESALDTEEMLIDRLDRATGDGALAGFQAIAQVVPSAARQRENRALVHDRLIGPFLSELRRAAGNRRRRPARCEPAGTHDACRAPRRRAARLPARAGPGAGSRRRVARGAARRRCEAGRDPSDRPGDAGRPPGGSRRRSLAAPRTVPAARRPGPGHFGGVDAAGGLRPLRAARRIAGVAAAGGSGAGIAAAGCAGRGAVHLLQRHGAGPGAVGGLRLCGVLPRERSGGTVRQPCSASGSPW